jgi:hypothetical protein
MGQKSTKGPLSPGTNAVEDGLVWLNHPARVQGRNGGGVQPHLRQHLVGVLT